MIRKVTIPKGKSLPRVLKGLHKYLELNVGVESLEYGLTYSEISHNLKSDSWMSRSLILSVFPFSG